LALEIVRLAVLGQEQAIAVEVGNQQAVNMLYYSRYREAEDLCQRVLALGEDFRLLTQLARAEQRLGRKDTTSHIERAVALLPADRANLPEERLKESAVTMGAFADILQARGQLDAALEIREKEELPVYEELGDVQAKAVTMGKIADILWNMDAVKHAEDVRHLLCEALQAFTAMQLPGEAEWVQDKLHQYGLQCEGETLPDGGSP
jgi:tetratricopeptide (TPR) repeat protein